MTDENGRTPPQAEVVMRRTVWGWFKDMIRALIDWSARRPLTEPAGHQSIPHSSDVRMMVWAITVVDLITGVVVDGMVPPAFRPLHLLWVVGVLVLSLGFCAMTARTPHLINESTLRVRTGPLRELTIPLAKVSTVRHAHGAVTSHGLRRVLDESDAVACSVSSATTLILDLTHAIPVKFRKGGTVMASRIYFSADEPSKAAQLINRAAVRSGERMTGS
ncbi:MULTISPECIES: hypothetical protein [unclassified Streptomyces]|uniref:hypothetical protein n=1 Tax=unclassified Streptomyces TaxID=2593676 RepID=UPI001BECC25C|nr:MULTISPECIES: hypothetical protein [unclassified Streptomyces]MBT2446343.1 hypothetical protein [Streptomyces sp. ISL-43]MBT2478769.1 hypothetical protein [Streptomyces sp. ISL-94]